MSSKSRYRPPRRVSLRESTGTLTLDPSVLTQGTTVTGSSTTWTVPPTVAAPVAESAPPVQSERVALRETPSIVEAPGTRTPGRMLVKLIQAGWNANGTRYYPAAVLERDRGVFKRGTFNMVDHATEGQEAERPEGSLRDLASVQTTDAYWDAQQQALMAEVRLFATPWREAITDMAPYIGMSIRAEGLGTYGEAEGREGLIISEISHAHSVDYVTRPGAGGGIVELLESARATRLREDGSIGAGIEALIHSTFTDYCDQTYARGLLTREERISLSNAVGDALAAFVTRVESDQPQLYARDRWGYEATTVTPDAADDTTSDVGMAESTTTTDIAAGSAPPVVDAPPAADEPPDGDGTQENAPGTSPDTEGQEEGDMPDETELVQAREAQVAAEQARDAALREATEVRERLARLTAVEAARPIASLLLAESDLPQAAQSRLLASVTADVPLTEANVLDEAAFRARASEAITSEGAYLAAVREAAGEGVPSGLGTRMQESADPATDGEWKTKLAERFQRLGGSPEAAKIAARGRVA